MCRIPFPARKYIPRIDRKLTLCTLSRRETSRSIVGPKNERNIREKVISLRTHIIMYAVIESSGFQRKSVLKKSGMEER